MLIERYFNAQNLLRHAAVFSFMAQLGNRNSLIQLKPKYPPTYIVIRNYTIDPIRRVETVKRFSYQVSSAPSHPPAVALSALMPYQ
jgi:hypothetical protein